MTNAVVRRDRLRSLRASSLGRLAGSRPYRVLCLVAGIWLLNAFDLSLTALSHKQGFLHEQNPFARHMLGYGLLSVVLYKVGLVLIGSYPLVKFRTARIAEMGALVVLIAYASVAIRWSQCYDWYALAISPTSHSVVDTAQDQRTPS